MKSPPSDSFEGQILALLPSLRRYSRSLTRSDFEGDDLLQDCVEKMLSRRSQWRGSNLRGWGLTIMTNLYRNMLRSKPRRMTANIDEIDDIPVTESSADPLEHSKLYAALNNLPADSRAIIMLVVVEGYSYREVAEMLDIPIGTVMSRLSRTRQRLAGQMTADNIITLRR